MVLLYCIKPVCRAFEGTPLKNYNVKQPAGLTIPHAYYTMRQMLGRERVASMQRTESSRLVRGARTASCEYILEHRTEILCHEIWQESRLRRGASVIVQEYWMQVLYSLRLSV